MCTHFFSSLRRLQIHGREFILLYFRFFLDRCWFFVCFSSVWCNTWTIGVCVCVILFLLIEKCIFFTHSSSLVSVCATTQWSSFFFRMLHHIILYKHSRNSHSHIPHTYSTKKNWINPLFFLIQFALSHLRNPLVSIASAQMMGFKATKPNLGVMVYWLMCGFLFLLERMR